MSLEKQLRDYKKIRKISPRENEILETVRKSGEAFLLRSRIRFYLTMNFYGCS